jgi:hypothetical protein
MLRRAIIAGDQDAPRVLAYDSSGNSSATITSVASRHASDLLRRDLLPEYITLGWNLAESVVRALNAALGRRSTDLVARFILACDAARECVLISRQEMAT